MSGPSPPCSPCSEERFSCTAFNYTVQSAACDSPLTFSPILPFSSCLPHIPAGLHHLSSILVYSSGDLVRRTGLSHPDVHTLLLVASKAHLPTFFPITALQMYRGEAHGYNQGRCHLCSLIPRSQTRLLSHGGKPGNEATRGKGLFTIIVTDSIFPCEMDKASVRCT